MFNCGSEGRSIKSFGQCTVTFLFSALVKEGEIRIIVTSSFCRCLDCGDLSGGGRQGQEGPTTTGS